VSIFDFILVFGLLFLLHGSWGLFYRLNLFFKAARFDGADLKITKAVSFCTLCEFFFLQTFWVLELSFFFSKQVGARA